MESKKGKFIVFYGTNNLGKTTQAKLLVKRLNSSGLKSEYIKYPIYDLEPAGKLVDDYYRLGNPYNFSSRESQLLHYIDRLSFEPVLKNKLNKGIHIIAEDYFGTALAWGLATGVEMKLLKYLYSFLYPEDLSILFDGSRFKTAIEIAHHHETDDELMNKARLAHLKVGQEYGWNKINANQPWQNIQQILWEKIINIIEKPAHYFIAPNFKELHDQIYTMSEIQDELTPTLPEDFKSAPQIIFRRVSSLARMPVKLKSGDFGFNFFAADYYSLPPKYRVAVKTGVKIKIPDGYTGLITNSDNTVGHNYVPLNTIGSTEGELKIKVINLNDDFTEIVPGQKIAKLVILKTESMEISEC